MKLKNITTRIMFTVLPVIVLATILLTSISYVTSSRIISAETTNKMMAVLDNELVNIQNELDKNAAVAQSLVSYAESAETADFMSGKYIKFMNKAIISNPNTIGGGIWYEPYKFKNDLSYFGPYVYMENGSPVFTDIYSNADYDYPNTDWYINGKNSSGGIAWSDVYYDYVSDITMLTGTQPFYGANNQFSGTTTADMNAVEIQRFVKDMKVGDTGRALLIGANGAYISYWDDTKTPNMLIYEDSDSNLAALGQMIKSNESGTALLVQNNVNYRVYYKAMPVTGWNLAIAIEEAELLADIRQMILIMIAVTLVTLAFMLLVIMALVKYLRSNINKINEFSRIVASGDFSGRLTIDSQDEFNSIAEQLNSMMDDMSRMSHESIDMLEKSDNLIQEISKSADEVSGESRRIVEASALLAHDSTRQADSVSELTKEASDIMVVTNENASKADDASALAVQIRDLAQKGQSQMEQMVGSVNGIAESSMNISRIIKVIDDIAFQTNILALNAAVEAARAGQHGKGFAVVADEVRNLASKSASAAKETASLIAESVEKANFGTQIADETSTSLNAIVSGINRSAEIIGSMSTANKNQAAAISNITNQIQLVSEIAHKNAQTAEDSSSSAERMNKQAECLNNLVRQYSYK